jgi:3,5-epimerase/4-reductase
MTLGDIDRNGGEFIMLLGSSGFIGTHIRSTLDKAGAFYVCSTARTYDLPALERDIIKFKPTAVINCSGYSTPTTVDWYEDHQQEMILTNTVGVVNVAHVCWQHGIHCTTIMSGCIYSGGPWADSDVPNFTGSAYSRNRVLTEQMLASYDTCVVRIRMPISASMHKKSLITKLLRYKKVSSQGNSITMLEDMLPAVYYLVKHRVTGNVNLVNHGTVSNIYILGMWDKYVAGKTTKRVYTEDPAMLDCKAPRSNCTILQSEVVTAIANRYNLKNSQTTAPDSIYRLMKEYKRVVDTYC